MVQMSHFAQPVDGLIFLQIPPMNKSIHLSVVAAIGLLSANVTAQAAMVYYMPFDYGADPSLANLGTAGGTATTTSPASPTTSTSVPNNLDSAYSERFTDSAQRLYLPSSTANFRLDSASPAQNMTVSLWMYIDATTYNWMDFFGTLSSASGGTTGSGWLLSIVGGNDANTKGKLRLSTPSGNLFSTSIVPLQQWVNFVITWTTADVSGGRTAYINGTSFLSGYGARTPTDSNPITLHGAATAANYDDLAMWDTILTQGKVRSLSTAPGLLDGYNAGVMNSLFTVYDAGTGSYAVDGMAWSYTSGFNVMGRSLGDTWFDNGSYYMWLGGNSGNALGLTAVPEPTAMALLVGLGLTLVLQRGRKTMARQ